MDNATDAEGPLAGHSINALAIASGIPYSTLRRKLLTPDAFTMGELLRLANAAKCSPGELIAYFTAAPKPAAAEPETHAA